MDCQSASRLHITFSNQYRRYPLQCRSFHRSCVQTRVFIFILYRQFEIKLGMVLLNLIFEPDFQGGKVSATFGRGNSLKGPERAYTVNSL